MTQEQPTRDDKARFELSQKVLKDAKEKISVAIDTIKVAITKFPQTQRAYLAMDLVNGILDSANCKTIVVHQPQIVPLSEAEIKQREEQIKVQQQMQEQAIKETELREAIPEGEKPKTVASLPETEDKPVEAVQPVAPPKPVELTEPETKAE